MINNLRSKIFWLLFLSILAVISAFLIAFLVLNYKSNMDNVSQIMLKFDDAGSINDNGIGPEENEEYYTFSVNNSSASFEKNKSHDNDIPNEEDSSSNSDDSGSSENSDNFSNPENSSTNTNSASNSIDLDLLKTLAIKASKEKNTSGIVGNYLYSYKKIGQNSYTVTLVPNSSITNHIRALFIFSAIAWIFSIIVIFFVSRKISSIIVKPVQETLDKQKQFISDASHELKTPLSIIELNSDVIEKKFGSSKWLKYIEQETESMNKLVNDLLLLSKTENSQSIESYTKFNLSNEIHHIISSFDVMATEKNVQIHKNIPDNIFFTGDSEDIKHILSTLLDNAIKHTAKNNNVFIVLEKEKNDIVLQVKNEGQPIPENERNKIFERFYRIDKSRNRKEKRYGLGLAIAKSTVEKYDGHIEVICKDGLTNFKVKMTSK